VATFILYYILATSGSKMASEGVWKIWFGSWWSTIILLPMGLFFTYQANKDSGVMNNFDLKNFFRKIFILSEKRNIPMKEVIIETPDYDSCYNSLNDIYNTAREYKAKNNLKHIPTLKYVFFNEKDDTLAKLDEKLEKTIEDLCNSKYRNIIIQLNEMPVLAIKPVSSPFKKRWMNIVLLFILPLSILIYARSVRFRIKLLMDLTKVERKSKEINEIIKKEKLI
jgi:lipopolysaccharide export system permease protein